MAVKRKTIYNLVWQKLLPTYKHDINKFPKFCLRKYFRVTYRRVQVNFCISNTDMSNTMQVSKWDGGPGRFNYIYDLRKPRYLEHINLEYLAYLEEDWQFQDLKHTHYLKSTKFLALLNSHL